MGSHSKRMSAVFVLGLVAALTLSGLMVLAPAARADGTSLPWRLAGYVSANTQFTRAFATVVADHQGHFFVVYNTQDRSSGLWNINATKFDTRGSLDLPRRLWDTQVDTATNTVVPSRLSAAMDHDGNLYVAYIENRGTGPEIYVSKLASSGTSFSAEVAVSSNVFNNYFPSIAVAPSGNVYVAWMYQASGHENLSFAASTDGGATFSAATNITAHWSFAGSTAVSMAVDSGGRIYIAYDYYDYSKRYYVANLSTSDDGSTWAEQSLSNPNSNVFVPSVLADSAGFVHVAWIDQQGGTYAVDYSRSSDGGATWTAPILLSVQGGTTASFPTSIAESGGTLMVTWTTTPSATPPGLGYATSADKGGAWSAPQAFSGSSSLVAGGLTVDENGTFYAAPETPYLGVTTAVSLLVWFGPPTAPTITGIARGTSQLTVSWTGSPEPNVNGYRVYRSTDGVTYSFVASVSASTGSYVDSGLAAGVYWYEVTALNDEAIQSSPSAPASATVGQTTAEQISALQAEIAALQAQIASLQGTSAANNATLANLKDELTNLQNQLNTLQGQQATQTISYANLAFEVIVVALLVVLLFFQMRKPKSPQLMMAQPGQVQAPPKQPEDDL